MRAPLSVLLLPLSAMAQSAMPTEFPADTVVLAADVLQLRMAGKVYKAKLTDGATWRLEYKSNGYIFLNTGSGFSDSGKWSVKGEQLCSEWTRAPSGCSETRANNEAIYIKRSSTGEVVALRPD
ncbi:hypothetical protein KIH07_01340 [Hydrogenophaga taeniospiralis]|uniref:hypothetical protein n=1 Tax=Hydrogenophaga taeniospiralis TaxID=65656 RepID=UPI001CFB5EE6|nr:hypothetical protein [Hydrogenophaga taeniospiralis]MCB4362357.1 hypothetical protein [Hydrogenophaga taeniospiralis]